MEARPYHRTEEARYRLLKQQEETLNNVQRWLTQNIGYAQHSPSKQVILTIDALRNLQKSWFGK